MFRSLTNIKSSVTSTLSSDTQDNDKSSSTLESDDEKRKEIIRDFRRILGAENEKYEDDTLIRFAVARSFNLEKAKQQLEEATKWREKQKINSIPLPVLNPGTSILCPIRGFAPLINDTNVEFVEGVPDSIPKIYKYFGGHAIHKIDKEGRALYIERLGYHDAKGLTKCIKSEDLVNWHIRCQEFSHKVLMPELSRRAGRLVDKETVIFDCEGMGFHQLHMPALYLYRTIAEIDQNYYPERLGKLFVINTPFMFVKIWAFAKRWLDPGMLKKVHICGEDFQNTLLQHIDEENLPSFLGGKCTCSHLAGGCVPSVVLKNIPPLEKKQNSLQLSLQPTLPSTPVPSRPPSPIPLESRNSIYNYRIRILKGDSKTCEVVITPPIKENDQTSTEIGFRKIEGKGKLEFHVKFINDDYGSLVEKKGRIIIEPITLTEEDIKDYTFEFKFERSEIGQFLLIWSFDEYSDSDNCIIEYFVKIDGDLYGDDKG